MSDVKAVNIRFRDHLSPLSLLSIATGGHRGEGWEEDEGPCNAEIQRKKREREERLARAMRAQEAAEAKRERRRRRRQRESCK